MIKLYNNFRYAKEVTRTVRPFALGTVLFSTVSLIVFGLILITVSTFHKVINIACASFDLSLYYLKIVKRHSVIIYVIFIRLKD